MTSLLLAASWLLTPALAACEDGGTAALLGALNDAERAHANLDVPGLQSGARDALGAVPCVDSLVSQRDAARLHRVVGLDAFTQQQRNLATRAFAAARAADPGFDFPTHVVPAGHPLRTYYLALPLDAGTTQAIGVPSGFEVRLDGNATTQRPLSWPSVTQVIDGGGRVLSTDYLWPEDALPDLLQAGVTAAPVPAPVATAAPAVAPAPVATAPADTGGRGLRRVALLSAVAAGGAYAGSWLTLRSYNQTGHTDDELDRLFLATNGLTVSAAAFGVVAVGTGIGAFVSGRF